MKFRKIKIYEKGIALIILIIIIIILTLLLSILIKGIFDFKSVGATGNNKLENKDAIGKYIEYSPKSGKYSAITNSKKYTGSLENSYDFITDTSLSWRIWSIDDNKITLISDKPVSIGGYKNLGAISLANCNGYNNGVKILNDICNNCYSNIELGAVARSINIDDIETAIDIEEWNPENYKTKTTELNTYFGRKEYKVTICYPYIYKEEQYSNIDNIEKENGIQRSEQDILYETNQDYLKAENMLKPLQTAWTKSKMSTKNFMHENYYYLLFKEGFEDMQDLMSYFIASRTIDLNENNISFGIFEVGVGNKIQTNTLFNSRGGSLTYWDRIRPIVEIPIENIEIDRTNDGMTKENAWKIKSTK